MANHTGTGPESYLAKRQIDKWIRDGVLAGDVDVKHTVRLYCSLKKMFGESGGRMTAQAFNGYTRKVHHSSSFKRKLWIVPKKNSVEHVSREFFVDPASLVEWPAWFDAGEYHIVDQAVPQSQLGPGVMEWETKVADTTTSVVSGQRASPATRTSLGSSASGSGAQQAEDPPPPAKRLRVLEKKESATDADAAENIACDTKKAFELGDVRGVEFWMMAMLVHVQSQRKRWTGEPDKFIESLDAFCAQYWRFVCTRMLSLIDYSKAEQLAKILSQVNTEFPELLSPLGQSVLLAISKSSDIESDLRDQHSFPEMSLAARAEFFRSTLYDICCKVFDRAKLSKMQEECKGGIRPSTQAMDDLYSSSADEDVKVSARRVG